MTQELDPPTETELTAWMPPSAAGEGQRVAQYRLLQKIGEGGMGEVWEAKQTEPVERRVALKLIKPGMDSTEVLARFESERQALALMDHSAIAKVFDAGTTESGRPFFAMEHIYGVPITQYCDRARMPVAERLELFIQVCEGIQHAHQKAIIHRDVKPSNILVTEENGKPTVKIIDFGVAKAVAQRLTERTLFTQLGQMIGTPEYMSPEQANPTSEDVDIRTDVYSLGMVLYQLLVGSLPFEPKELRNAGLAELQRRIREDEAPRPSTRVSRSTEASTSWADSRSTTPQNLVRELRGDLDWIAMKALAKERNRRYDTVNALALDVRRYLDEQPIEARPPSARYRATKFVRRHRFGVSVAALLALLLIGFSTVVAVQAGRIAGERDRAEREAARSRAVVDFLTETLASADPNQGLGRDVTVVEALYAAAGTVDEAFADQADTRAAVQTVLGSTYFQLGRIDEAEPFLREGLATRVELYGEASLEAAESRFALARLLAESGAYDEAEAALRQVIATRRELLGPEDPGAGDGLSLLGTVQRWRGAYDEAEASFQQALVISRAASEGPNPSTVNNLNGLGIVQRRLGELDAAEASYREALALGRELYGDEHMEVATTLNNLGVLYSTRGDIAQEIEFYRQALAIRRSVLGDNHFHVANSLQNIAMAYQAGGDLATAETYSRQAVEMNRSIFTAPHSRIAQSQRNLGVLLGRMGRHEEALELLEASLRMRVELFGEGHDDVANSRLSIAQVERRRGDYAEAERLVRQARATYHETLGEAHREYAFSLSELARILAATGRCAEAEPLYRQALEVLGPNGSREWIATSQAGLGLCLQATGDGAEAQRLLNETAEALPEFPWERRLLERVGEALEPAGAT